MTMPLEYVPGYENLTPEQLQTILTQMSLPYNPQLGLPKGDETPIEVQTAINVGMPPEEIWRAYEEYSSPQAVKGRYEGQLRYFGEELARSHDKLLQWESELRKSSPDLWEVYKKTKGTLEVKLSAIKGAVESFKQFQEDVASGELVATPDGKWVLKADLESLKTTDPEGYTILTTKGFQALGDRYDKFVKEHIQLGDGSWVKKTDFEKLQPTEQKLALSKGLGAITPGSKLYLVDENTISLLSAEAQAEYQKGSPENKFDLLLAYKILPQNAEYAGVDSKGNPEYRIGTGMIGSLIEATPAQLGLFAAEMVVPGLYTGLNWNKLSAGERALSIALDAMCIIPIGMAIGEGARAVSIPGRMARLAGGLRGLTGGVVAQVRAPIDMVLHPIATGRAGERLVQDIGEDVLRWSKLDRAVVTTSSGLVMLPVSDITSAKEAMAFRDQLMTLVAKGEKPVVILGDTAVTLDRSPLMKTLGGGIVHVTDDSELLLQSGKVRLKSNLPTREQGLFLANEPAIQFAEAPAHPGKSYIPVPPYAGEEVWQIGRYHASDLVKLDAPVIRELNLADAKSVPQALAEPFFIYIKANNGRIAGSFVEWLKVPNAMRPNDLDLVFFDRHKAIADLVQIAKDNGFDAKAVEKGVEVLVDNEWVRVAEIRSYYGYERMIPEGLTQTANKVKGVDVTRLGEQYLRQAYGSVAKDVKAITRAEHLQKANLQVLNMLKDSGATIKKPAIIIMSPKTAVKAISTEKLWRAKGIGLTAEMESKLPVDIELPEIGQRLFTRVGPRNLRVEILLDKEFSLKPHQIIKLKGLAVVENLVAPFKPAILVKDVKGAETISRGLNDGEIATLAEELERAGNRAIASSLRALQGISVIRMAPPTLEQVVRITAPRPEASRLVAERLDQLRTISQRYPESRGEIPRSIIPRIDIPRDIIVRETAPREIPPRVITPREITPREIPPREIPPKEVPPRETVPREEPPKEIPPRETVAVKEEQEIGEEQVPIAWKQGLNWVVIEPPYTQGNVHWLRKPPKGATVVKGIGSAYRTIQALGGDANAVLSVDMGVFDVSIVRPREAGKPGTIKFKRDVKSRTASDVTLKGVRAE